MADQAERSEPHSRWQLGVVASSAAILGVVLVLSGIMFQRTNVVVLGIPMLLNLVWNLAHRPTGSGRLTLSAAEMMREPGLVEAKLELATVPGVENLQLRVGAPGHQLGVALVAAAHDRDIGVSITTARTGQRSMFHTEWGESAADGMLLNHPRFIPAIMITVHPATRALKTLPLPFRLPGLTGAHDSRRAGEGGDLHDVHVFTPGARLRRIDWRVTARRAGQGSSGRPGEIGELYVRRTFATADATIMLVLDSRDDVGPDVGTWDDANTVREDQATSLDIAREAAASLARHYLDNGDRVGLEDVGRLRRPAPPSDGRARLHRLVQHLAVSQPIGEPTRRKRAPRLPSGALIIVFSTFLDDDMANFAQSWRRSGHRVLAVDVLPRLTIRGLDVRQRTAWRIVRMERVDRLRDLSSSGVELIHWEGEQPNGQPAPSVEVAMAALARARRGRR